MSRELLLHLVKTQYGSGFEQILQPFFDADELQLGEIAKAAKIENEELRSMLVILLKSDIIEHNQKLQAGKYHTYYKLNVENILNISLYPRYLAVLEDKFDATARSLAETLILNGKMSADDCIQGTKQQLEIENGEGSIKDDKEYFNEFGNLVKLGYFIPVHKTASSSSSEAKPDGLNLEESRPSE